MKDCQKKYNKVWDKVSNTIKTVFDIQPAYKEKYLKNKIKIYERKIKTNFKGDGIPKEGP